MTTVLTTCPPRPPSPLGSVQATVELLFEPGEADTDTDTATPPVDDVNAAVDAAVDQATATANAIIDQTNAAINAAVGTAGSTLGDVDTALSGAAGNLVQVGACIPVCEQVCVVAVAAGRRWHQCLLRVGSCQPPALPPPPAAPALPTCLPAAAPR